MFVHAKVIKLVGPFNAVAEVAIALGADHAVVVGLS
jgi:hypothetical protein